MDVFVARQPVFDAQKNIFGYELLFRTGYSNSFPEIDGETATSSLLSTSFFTVGIENISAGKKVFINFTEELLNSNAPMLFPADKIIVEVLEDVPATPEIILACKKLVDNNYALALDDFIYQKDLQPLIQLAQIIKIDFKETSLDEIRKIVARLKGFQCELLAEKIETYQEFEQAVEMGFSYFQGYFFARPEVLPNKDISVSQLTVLQLINEVNRSDVDIERIKQLVKQDLSVSYKLLHYLNIENYFVDEPFSSIDEAISFLGLERIKSFVSLVAAGKLSEQKPSELMKTAIIRARFLEQVGEETGQDGKEFFMLGLFSLIDAMLDNTMTYLATKLPLSEPIWQALLERKGTLLPYLELVESYESCKWSCIDNQLALVGIPGSRILEFYLNALRMADVRGIY